MVSSNDLSLGSMTDDQALQRLEQFRAIVSPVVKTNRYMARFYVQTFVGEDAVSALVDAKVASSREAAVQLGQDLAARYDLFEHVCRQHLFQDAFLFYRFKKDGGGRIRETAAGGRCRLVETPSSPRAARNKSAAPAESTQPLSVACLLRQEIRIQEAKQRALRSLRDQKKRIAIASADDADGSEELQGRIDQYDTEAQLAGKAIAKLSELLEQAETENDGKEVPDFGARICEILGEEALLSPRS